jgi:hypothetical protein
MRIPRIRQLQGVFVRRSWVGIGVVVALVATVALPGTASARKVVVRTASMKVQATAGYKAYVFANHQLRPRRRAEIEVVVYKGDQSAEYSVRGVLTKRRLQANLGPFGRVHLRIIGNGHRPASGSVTGRLSAEDVGGASRVQPATKRGRSALLLCGTADPFARKTFRGRIRFEGENGYTTIHADQAKGAYFFGKAGCSRGHRARGTFLTAKSGPLEFFAGKYKSDPRHSYLYASEEETAGRVSIERSAGNYRGAVFDFNSDFTTAHVEPSEGPLSGSADFAAPDEWTGDLTASFPGEPPVALTGAGFSARLRHR